MSDLADIREQARALQKSRAGLVALEADFLRRDAAADPVVALLGVVEIVIAWAAEMHTHQPGSPMPPKLTEVTHDLFTHLDAVRSLRGASVATTPRIVPQTTTDSPPAFATPAPGVA